MENSSDTSRLEKCAEKCAIVGIGASAGGLEAIRQVFAAHESVNGEMAFVIVQHLDPTHESLMAQLIERYTTMRVRQVEATTAVEPDQIYIIPPGHGLRIEKGVLHLTEFVDPRGMRRPIDDFFQSLAEDQGVHAACVILSGTGADGSRGLRAVKEQGGICIAQEPKTAKYDGMPRSAIATGMVDLVRDPERIIETLTEYYSRDARKRDPGGEADVLAQIDALCEALFETMGHDFSGYKRTTLTRRITRRMQVLGMKTAAEYVVRVRNDPGECEALFRDLLIHVTRFFRDKEAFTALYEQIVKPLVASRLDDEEIRVWIPGCSSGEEPYSVAMLFAEAARAAGKHPYIQIFATDIDEASVKQGREAVYPTLALADIPPEFRNRYVVGHPDHFSLTAPLREMVRFSIHSLVRDPPFSKIDLICCRNLLIYLDEALQQTVIPLFHFSLRQDGMLFLGTSEGVGRFEDLFEPRDLRMRLFRRKTISSRYALPQPPPPRKRRPVETAAVNRPRESWVETTALRKIAEQYAPVTLLVDPEGYLLQRWGSAGRYLDFPDRLERRIHAVSLAKQGLREALSTLLKEGRATGRRVVARDVSVETDFGVQKVAVLSDPLGEEAFLIVIRETQPLDPFQGDDIAHIKEGDGHISFLEDELQSTRQRLRSTVEELETTNEELKSSNEEMMSMNEELQSTNEELTTVNDELKNKIDQLIVANSDLKNFFDSTRLVVVVVDQNLHVRSATAAATGVFKLSIGDRGRSLGDMPSSLADSAHVSMAQRAARNGESSEARLQSADGQKEFIARAFPYRRIDGSVDGAILVFTDITEALSLERQLAEERHRLRLALEVAKIGVWEYEPHSDRVKLDKIERGLLGVGPDETVEQMEPIMQRVALSDRDRVNTALRRAMDGDVAFDEVFEINVPDSAHRFLHGMGQRIMSGGERKFVGVTYDVTAEREVLAQRELLIREMNHRVKNLFAVVAAMVTISARDSGDVKELSKTLRDRIHALGRSHALTIRNAEDSLVDLRELIQVTVEPILDGQLLELDGPDIAIEGPKLTPLSLILYEWATNAAKYGALSDPAGTLKIDWSCDDRLTIRWRETSPSIVVAKKAGFGTRLVQATVQQLRGVMEERPGLGRFDRSLSLPL